MNKTIGALAWLSTLAASGCEEGSSPGTSGPSPTEGAGELLLRVDGRVEPTLSDEMNTLAVVGWSDGEAHAQVYGRGPQAGGSFSVELRTPAPAAIFASGFAVGMVALYDAERAPPDGPVLSFVDGAVRGAELGRAIVYRDGEAVPADYPWAAAFPVGFSCATCVRGEDGDRLAPAPCEELTISPFSDTDVGRLCLWSEK